MRQLVSVHGALFARVAGWGGVAHHPIEIEQLRSQFSGDASRRYVMQVTKPRCVAHCQPQHCAFTCTSAEMFIHVDF
ncbi:hypothetical protein Rhow_001530 [Rhodococcus wratislaviensis]|uniref:Uncharacterized protein n=1 Tax=Rhodococcus wratislaviensis TaxID=44752 RepID=A0A402BXY5_RHOWR|nr:hypothetical protein Rhow_001530 [Rhodococcus wratislaviensis]